MEELTAGDMFIGFLCSARSTRQMYKVARKRAKRRYAARLAVERLVSDGYVTAVGEKLSISVSGKELFRRAVSVKQTVRKKVWDGKWRVVIFDVPQRFAYLRTELRAVLKRAGFHMLQKSVWVFPHDCRHLSDLLSEDKRLRGHVLYGVFESIEGDLQMRRVFNLPEK